MLYNVAGQSLVLGLSLVAIRLILTRLGGDVFGIIFFILTLSPLVVSALDLGLSSTIVREVSQHYERDVMYVSALSRTASTAYWVLYALAALALLLLAPIIVAGWVHLSGLDRTSAAALLRVLGLGALTALPRGFYGSVLRGLQRMKHNNVIDVSMALLQQGGAAALLASGAGSFTVVVWLAACFALGTAAYLVTIGVLLGWGAVVPGWSPAVVERNRDFSARVFAISLLNMISLQLDRLFVSKLLPIVVFGFYSFAGSLASRSMFVAGAIYVATLPALSSLLANADRTGAHRQYRKLQDLQCLLAVPTLAVVLYAETPLVTYAFNQEVARALVLPLVFLCLAFFLQVATATPMAFLIASGQPGLVAMASLMGLAVSAPLGLALAIALGLPGAALCYLTYSLVTCAFMVSRGARRFSCAAPSLWYLHAGRILLAGAAIYGAPLALALRLSPSPVILAALYLAASAVFGALAYRRLMGSELMSSLPRLSGRQP